MNIYTPDNYVLAQLSLHPSLYSCNTLDAAKLKIFNQLFNVIGNGVRDHDELIEELTVDPAIDLSSAVKYITDEDIYYGFYKVKKIGSFEMGEGDSIDSIDSERVNHPKVKYWLKVRRDFKFNPYPNFNENYSIVHRSDFHLLGKEWAEAAIWFYKKSREFFQTSPEHYWNAFPQATERETKNQLDDFVSRLTAYSNNDEISTAYELEYTGNPEQFLELRWQKELARINEFITSTITKLETYL